MAVTLAPARGTIEYKLPEYEARTRFFNMYDSLEAMSPFEPVEVVGYESHVVELVRAEGDDQWKTASADDELVQVIQGEVAVVFQENGRRVASGRAVKGEILLLPQGLEYRLSGSGSEPGLFLHYRTRGGD